MAESLPESAPAHSVLTRAVIYLWDHPTVTAVCGMDHAVQRDRCSAWATRQGWPVVAILVDGAQTTSEDLRPARQQLLAVVQERQCEVVILPALASLGPQIGDVLALLETLAQQGVDIICLHETFDTTTAHGSFALLVVRALARIEQSPSPELPALPPTAAPITLTLAASASPQRQRQQALPFGYRHTSSGVAIDPDNAPIVRWIFRMHAAGATLAELLQLLRNQGGRRWNQRTLSAVLADEDAYRGGPHPDGGSWPRLLDAHDA